MRHAPARARAGFTVVEAVLALALFLILFSSAVLAARGGAGAFRNSQGKTDLEARLRRTLDRVAFELMSSGASTLMASPASGSGEPDSDFGAFDFQFCQAIGVNGTAPQWGPTLSLARQYAPGELDDGLDNDGNGVTDEAGFNVHRRGEVLFVRLTLEESLESGTLIRTLETAVRLRND